MKENDRMRWFKFFGATTAFVGVVYLIFQYLGITSEVSGNAVMFLNCMTLAYVYWIWYDIEKLKINRR